MFYLFLCVLYSIFLMQVMDSLNNQKEHMKQSVKKWNSEKSANEEYIAQVNTSFNRKTATQNIAKMLPQGFYSSPKL